MLAAAADGVSGDAGILGLGLPVPAACLLRVLPPDPPLPASREAKPAPPPNQ